MMYMVELLNIHFVYIYRLISELQSLIEVLEIEKLKKNKKETCTQTNRHTLNNLDHHQDDVSLVLDQYVHLLLAL